jgi:hypothetical protein
VGAFQAEANIAYFEIALPLAQPGSPPSLRLYSRPYCKGAVVHAGPDHGTSCMSASKSNGSTIKKPVRWMLRAPIKRRNTSAACAALKSAATITLRALISSGTRKRVHGVKITAV